MDMYTKTKVVFDTNVIKKGETVLCRKANGNYGVGIINTVSESGIKLTMFSCNVVTDKVITMEDYKAFKENEFILLNQKDINIMANNVLNQNLVYIVSGNDYDSSTILDVYADKDEAYKRKERETKYIEEENDPDGYQSISVLKHPIRQPENK